MPIRRVNSHPNCSESGTRRTAARCCEMLRTSHHQLRVHVRGSIGRQRLCFPTTDGRDRCLQPTTTYSVLATAPACRQAIAMTRCLLRRGPLHCTPLTDGSRIAALLHTPCWLHCVPAQDGAKGIEGQASVSPSRTCTMSASCWLSGSVSRCAYDAARRCPQQGLKARTPARPPET